MATATRTRLGYSGRCRVPCRGTRTSSRRFAPTSTTTEQHAAVRCAANDRQALEQLCRTITRCALANKRVQANAAGQVVLKLKTAWRDGTTHPAPVAAGVHAAAGCAGAQTEAAPDPFGARVSSLRQVSGPPLREPWRSRTRRQAARGGGAAGTRTTRAGRTARRMRGDVRAPPPGAVELGGDGQHG